MRLLRTPERARGADTASMITTGIRSAEPADEDVIWAILEPVLRAGDTYALPRQMSRAEALAFWFAASAAGSAIGNNNEVFVAESAGRVVGTYFLRPNQRGGGAHVANCGYITAAEASGKGVATAMCAHSLDRAIQRRFRAMQFNFVVSTNGRAVRLWQRFKLEIVGTLPGAFLHPLHGYVDAYIMYRQL